MGADPGEGEIAGWLEEVPIALAFKDWWTLSEGPGVGGI